MKKVMTVVLLVLLLASLLLQPVSAAGLQASMTASTQSVKPGDTIDFNISVSSSGQCDQFGLILEFNREAFELVSGSCTASMSNEDGDEMIAVKSFSKRAGVEGFAISFFEAVTYNGKVGKFTLRVLDGASDGSYTITFRTSAKLGASSVPFGASSVTVNVAGETVTEPTEPEETEPKPSEHKHTFSTKWSSDKNQHWHECTGCGEKKDVKKHTPGPEATETAHQRCTVCNYVIKEALGHTHDYGDEWQFDSQRHWHICECGKKSDIANHTWDSNGECKKCDAKKVEETQPEETTAPAETTQPTVETTEATEPVQQPSRPSQNTPQTDPTEPDDEGFTDAQWGFGGFILAAVVILVIVAYFFIAKKRQK